MRRQIWKTSIFMPILIKSCLCMFVCIWVSGSIMRGTTRKVCFLEQHRKVVFSSSPWLILNAPCLSFMADSEYKDVALLSNLCTVPVCGPALLLYGIGKNTNQFRLDEYSFGANKSFEHFALNVSIKHMQ